MVVIPSQFFFGADKAVQISQAVFFDKEHNLELWHKNCKITLLIWMSDLHYDDSFGFKHSEIFNIALLSMHTQQIFLSWSFNLQNDHQSFSMKTGR